MSVPPELVARVFHDVAFQKPDTRITASTVALSTEYMRLFIKEAIVRANDVRLEEEPLTAIDGIDNVVQATQPLQNVDQFGDASVEEEDVELPEQEEQPPTSSASTLDTRHLKAVAGVLVLDF